MEGLLEKLDASIEACMPPEQAKARRELRQADEDRVRQLRLKIRNDCALAIEDLAGALRMNYPKFHLERAAEAVLQALADARELE